MAISKSEIYRVLLESEICKFGEYGQGVPVVKFNFAKILSNPDLNIKMLEYIGNRLNSVLSDVEYARVIAAYQDSYVYAVDIAVSNAKKLMFPKIVAQQSLTNDNDLEDSITFPDIFDIDEPVILVVSMITPDNYKKILKLVNMIEQYGAKIVSLVEIVTMDYGYELAFKNSINYIKIFNICELCDYGENNGLIDLFFFEKYKFSAEVSTKNMAAQYPRVV